MPSWLPVLIPKTPADVYSVTLQLMQFWLYAGMATIVMPAPHGKWGPRGAGGFKVNGNIGWIVMEIWGPFFLVLSMCSSSTLPTTGSPTWSNIFASPSISNFLALPLPNQLLGGFYLLHYLNRAVLQPLRSPPRTPMAWYIPLSAALFQTMNGFLIGNWLAGRTPSYILSPSVIVPPPSASASAAKGFLSFFARSVAPPKPLISPSTVIVRPGLIPSVAFRSPIFWIGLIGAVIGAASNIYHDEILTDLRRKPKVSAANGVASEVADAPAANTRSHGNGKGKKAADDLVQIGQNGTVVRQEEEAVGSGNTKYKIPYGGLFEYIDHPHYVSEWLEWTFWAIASLVFLPALVPSPTSAIVQPGSLSSKLKWYGTAAGLLFKIPTSLFAINSVAVTGPRAVAGHQWYKKTFGDKYPKNRKAIIPGVL